VKSEGEFVGGVNHCSLHCRLAKFRGLMYRGKYGGMIGRDARFCVYAQLQLPGYGFFCQSQRSISSCTWNHGTLPNDSV